MAKKIRNFAAILAVSAVVGTILLVLVFLLPDFQEEPVETEKIQLIENPLPLPKKHVPKVLDYKLDNDDDSDFDYPVADDDDFDH